MSTLMHIRIFLYKRIEKVSATVTYPYILHLINSLEVTIQGNSLLPFA